MRVGQTLRGRGSKNFAERNFVSPFRGGGGRGGSRAGGSRERSTLAESDIHFYLKYR